MIILIKKTILIPLNVGKQPHPEKGDLLLSEPFLPDSNFSRSVILLCEHSEEGSFGLILNQSIEMDMTSLSDDLPGIDIITGFGGPVERNHLYFLHNNAELDGAMPVGNELYMGGDYESLKVLLESGEMKPESIRFFIGYTGWTVGQLDEEIKEFSWIVTKKPVDFDILTKKNDDMWKELIGKLGGKYKIMSDYPINPADN